MIVLFKGEEWYLYEVRRSYFEKIKKMNPYCLVNIWRNKDTETKMVLMQELKEKMEV